MLCFKEQCCLRRLVAWTSLSIGYGEYGGIGVSANVGVEGLLRIHSTWTRRIGILMRRPTSGVRNISYMSWVASALWMGRCSSEAFGVSIAWAFLRSTLHTSASIGSCQDLNNFRHQRIPSYSIVPAPCSSHR